MMNELSNAVQAVLADSELREAIIQAVKGLVPEYEPPPTEWREVWRDIAQAARTVDVPAIDYNGRATGQTTALEYDLRLYVFFCERRQIASIEAYAVPAQARFYFEAQPLNFGDSSGVIVFHRVLVCENYQTAIAAGQKQARAARRAFDAWEPGRELNA